MLDNAIFGSISLPDWFVLDDVSDFELSSNTGTIFTAILFFVVTGIIVPLIEELYYRKLLQEHLSSNKTYAYLIGGTLFAISHAYTFYTFFTVLALGILLAFVYYKWNSVKLNITLHLTSNVLTKTIIVLSVIQAVVE